MCLRPFFCRFFALLRRPTTTKGRSFFRRPYPLATRLIGKNFYFVRSPTIFFANSLFFFLQSSYFTDLISRELPKVTSDSIMIG